jgi:hypothetical protein
MPDDIRSLLRVKRKRGGMLGLKEIFELHVRAMTSCKVLAVDFAQRADARISVLVTNFAVAITTTIIETGIATALGH